MLSLTHNGFNYILLIHTLEKVLGCARARMAEKTQRKAFEILTAAKNARLTLGKHPVGLAASALYLAGIMCGEKVTQEAISEASGVTEVTIRNVYHELKESLYNK